MGQVPKKRRQRRGPRGDGYTSFDRSRGKYRATVPLGAGKTATRYFAAQADADLWRRQRVAERDTPQALIAPPKPDRQSVNSALIELLDSRDYHKPNTERTYELYLRYLTAAMGDTAVGDVTVKEIATMDRAHRHGKRPLSISMADGILALLGTLYRNLVALQVVTFNPVSAYLTITPARARGGVAARKPVALDPGMCRLILRQLDNDPYQPLIAWLMVTGLRIGEALGLRVVNLVGNIAHIVEQVPEADRFTSAPLKTPESARDIPIPALLLAMTPIPSDGLLFQNRDGGSFSRATIRLHFNAACDRAKVQRIHLHDCRHTAATGMINLGMSEAFEAALLGHSPSSQTLRYARPKPEALRPWVEEWAKLVLGEAKMRQTGT